MHHTHMNSRLHMRQVGHRVFITFPTEDLDLTNSMAYGTRRFNATFTRALQYPYPKSNQPNSAH